MAGLSSWRSIDLATAFITGIPIVDCTGVLLDAVLSHTFKSFAQSLTVLAQPAVIGYAVSFPFVPQEARLVLET